MDDIDVKGGRVLRGKGKETDVHIHDQTEGMNNFPELIMMLNHTILCLL